MMASIADGEEAVNCEVSGRLLHNLGDLGMYARYHFFCRKIHILESLKFILCHMLLSINFLTCPRFLNCADQYSKVRGSQYSCIIPDFASGTGRTLFQPVDIMSAQLLLIERTVSNWWRYMFLTTFSISFRAMGYERLASPTTFTGGVFEHNRVCEL